MPADVPLQEATRQFVFPRWQIDAFKRWYSLPVPVLDKAREPTNRADA